MKLQKCIERPRVSAMAAGPAISTPVHTDSDICLAQECFTSSKRAAAGAESAFARNPGLRASTTSQVLYAVTAGLWGISALLQIASGNAAAASIDLVLTGMYAFLAVYTGPLRKTAQRPVEKAGPVQPAPCVTPARNVRTKDGEEWLP